MEETDKVEDQVEDKVKEDIDLYILKIFEDIENILDDIHWFEKEIKEKQNIYESSVYILTQTEYPEYEHIYQDYRCQFSNAYFSGSPWYVGDSLTLKNNSFSNRKSLNN